MNKDGLVGEKRGKMHDGGGVEGRKERVHYEGIRGGK